MSRRNRGRFDLIGALCIAGSLILPLVGWALIRATDRDICKTAGDE